MKIKAKKKLTQKLKKKSIDILSVTVSYHGKKNKYWEKRKKKIDEKEIKEHNEKIYEFIKQKNYKKKPTELYLNIIENQLVLKGDEKTLQKISIIVQYKLIFPIEIIYKYNYEKINKLSNEKDKCSICWFIFYENEEESDNNTKDNISKIDNKAESFENLFKKSKSYIK